MANDNEVQKTAITVIVGAAAGWLTKVWASRERREDRERKFNAAVEVRAFDSMEKLLASAQAECDSLKKELFDWQSRYYALLEKHTKLEQKISYIARKFNLPENWDNQN